MALHNNQIWFYHCAVEDQNFALFNYVNELNGEIEIVQEQIQHIHADIEQFKSQGVEMEQKRKNILSGLEKELEGIIDEAASQDSRYSAASKILDQLKSGQQIRICHVGKITSYVHFVLYE